MQRRVFRTITMLALFLSVAVASVQAQSRSKIETHIPFDFIAGEARYAAGNYQISQLTTGALLLRSSDGRTRAILQAPQSAAASTASQSAAGKVAREGQRLVFRRYGEQFFLSQVWLPGAGGGRALDVTGAERQLISIIEVSGIDVSQQTIEVGAPSK